MSRTICISFYNIYWYIIYSIYIYIIYIIIKIVPVNIVTITILIELLLYYILADRWSRTNPNCAQTQTSNKPEFRTNPNFEQTKKFLALGGLRIIRPEGELE